MPALRALTLVCDTPWAITKDSLRMILQIAERQSLDVDLARAIRADRQERPSALAARGGRRLDGARSPFAWVRNGVAVLEVTGPIVRYADFFSEISGATSAENLALDLQVALDDASVTAILLVIDSPGGEVTGIHELGEQIYTARSQKPIAAYVEGLGASAAYWLASATGEIVADPTAGLGSIGVVMPVRDPDKTKAMDIEIVSSQSPQKRPDVRTERGRAQYQTIVDHLADVFVETVARNRDVSADHVLEKFGQGGILIGKHAVSAGLADRLGGFEETLARLSTQGADARLHPQARALAQENGMDWGTFWKGFFAGLTPTRGMQVALADGPIEGPIVDPTIRMVQGGVGDVLRVGDLMASSLGSITSGSLATAQAEEPLPAEEPAAPAEPADDAADQPTPADDAVTSEPASEPEPPADEQVPASEPAAQATAAVAPAARDELAVARARIAELEAQQRTARWEALARGWYGETALHLQVLTALADQSGENSPAWNAYVQTQRAASAAIHQSGLFQEFGSDALAEGNQDAWGRIQARAHALRKEQPKLTTEQAIKAVLERDPALYAAYRAEQG